MLSYRSDPFDFPKNYHCVINRPSSEADLNGVNIGPTAVDFSMLPSAPIPRKEVNLLRRWKDQDLSQFYREQGGNHY